MSLFKMRLKRVIILLLPAQLSYLIANSGASSTISLRLGRFRSKSASGIICSVGLIFVLAGCRYHGGSSEKMPTLISDSFVPSNQQIGKQTPDFGSYQTPTNLASRIASADQIVVTNVIALGKDFARTGLLLSGDSAKEVVRAVSFARCYVKQRDPGWVDIWELQFYKGTNLLASVNFVFWGFRYDDRVYTDQTGVLRNLDEKLRVQAGM